MSESKYALTKELECIEPNDGDDGTHTFRVLRVFHIVDYNALFSAYKRGRSNIYALMQSIRKSRFLHVFVNSFVF